MDVNIHFALLAFLVNIYGTNAMFVSLPSHFFEEKTSPAAKMDSDVKALVKRVDTLEERQTEAADGKSPLPTCCEGLAKLQQRAREVDVAERNSIQTIQNQSSILTSFGKTNVDLYMHVQTLDNVIKSHTPQNKIRLGHVEAMKKQTNTEVLEIKEFEKDFNIQLKKSEQIVVFLSNVKNQVMDANAKVSNILQTQISDSNRLARVEQRIVELECPTGKFYRITTVAKLCLRFFLKNMNFTQSRTLCEQEPRGRIIHLDTKAKINAVNAYASVKYRGYAFNVGIVRTPRRIPAQYLWTNGQPVTVFNWAPGEPDNTALNDCSFALPSSNLRWFNFKCSDRRALTICEIA